MDNVPLSPFVRGSTPFVRGGVSLGKGVMTSSEGDTNPFKRGGLSLPKGEFTRWQEGVYPFRRGRYILIKGWLGVICPYKGRGEMAVLHLWIIPQKYRSYGFLDLGKWWR